MHEDDQAHDLARDFCVEHKIADKNEQHNVLVAIDTKIEEYRRPRIVQ